MKILVYVEAQAGQITGASLELIAGGHKLADGGEVDLALFGIDPAVVSGMADRVYTDPALAGAAYNPAQHAAGLEAAIAQSAPDLILVGYTTAGLDIGPAIAMRRALPMLAYCLSAEADAAGVRVESQIYGGKLTSSSHAAFPAMLMMNAGAFRDAPAASGRATEVVNLSLPAASGVRFVSATAPDPNAVDITKADRLLCVGRGIGDADVIGDAFDTARLMGAELVGSRPVIDAGWLPKERQVGKSGRKVKPQLYLSVGVSGAPEHIEGMGDSGLIIAINTDAAAPIFDYAHLGATVDLADFLPAFREALAKGRHNPMTQPMILGLLVLMAGSVFVYRFYRVLAPVLRAPAVQRFDQPAARAAFVAAEVGLHRRLLRKSWSGVLHLFVFTGFIVLFTAIVQGFGAGLIPGFSLAPIGGTTWIALLQDIFAVLILVGVAMAAWQRAVMKPKRFVGSKASDAWIIYALVIAVAGSMLLEFAFHILASGLWSGWRPVSGGIASVFAAAGVTPAEATVAEHAFYWVHIAAVLAFLIYIPGSKHRHIFTAIPNIYLRNHGPKGQLPPAGTDAPGISHIDQFNWKHKLDLISCTECGRCQEACPANAAGMPLSPKKVIMDLRDHMFDREAGRCHDTPLIGGVIAPETLWACTSCRACLDVCPVHIEPMTKIIEMRRSLVEDGAIEPMLQDALASLQRNGNSLGKPGRQRAKWTRDLSFKIKDARSEPVDILWFVGDYASFDPRVQRITVKVAETLHAAGVNFGILYDAEQNSGNDVRRVGEEGVFEMLAKHNIDVIDACDFQRIMTTDPHSLNALRQEYKLFGRDYDVVHYTQLLLELIEAGQLKVDTGDATTVTYHDPCYLGRYNGGFDAPREIIRRAGHHLHEMGRCRENSFCCGAGGGRIWMDDSMAVERPSENRIREALDLGDVKMFVVACPKDTVMYTAAVQNLGATGRIEVRDIIDLVRP